MALGESDPKCHIVTIHDSWSGMIDDDSDSDGGAHSILSIGNIPVNRVFLFYNKIK
jgi:hypothetical protein